MTIKSLFFLILLLPFTVHASTRLSSNELIDKTPVPKEICNASPFGTYCELQVRVKPSPKFTHYTYCGRTYVSITKKQREVLNSYLVEHKNMVLTFTLDDEFINAPCF